jgi:hypothetical protein
MAAIVLLWTGGPVRAAAPSLHESSSTNAAGSSRIFTDRRADMKTVGFTGISGLPWVFAITLFSAWAMPANAQNTGAKFCVAKPGAPDSALQKSLDWACGSGADRAPIQPGGACYQPNTVRAHASYAMSSYYKNKTKVGRRATFQEPPCW